MAWKKNQPGCPCCTPLICNVVFDNAYNATGDTPPPATCPGGPWYDDIGDPADLNPLWWSLVSGSCASSGHATPSTHMPCGGGTGGQSTVKIDSTSGHQTILLNTTSVQKTSFRLFADFYPRTSGDTLQVFIDYLDDCNHTLIEFVATDHAPSIAVYRVVAGVRTKLYRRANVSGSGTEGFYFNRALVPCPGIRINISLARSTLFVRVSGAEGGAKDGTQPNPGATTYGSLNYDWDWSGLHPNPEPNGITGPGTTAPGPDIGYRPLIISCGIETSGVYNMTRDRWAIGGIVDPAGDYFEIGQVKVWNTDLEKAKDDINGDDCGAPGLLTCRPDFVCDGLLTMYPKSITLHSQGVSCGPKGRLWENCDTTATTYTDCSTTLGAPNELVSEELCDNFGNVATGRDFVTDWTPIHLDTIPNPCQYFTGHTATVDANNPAYKHEYVHCGGGTDQDAAIGHEGFVILGGGVSTGDFAAGFGVEDNVTPPVHTLSFYPAASFNLPRFWKPGDAFGKIALNNGIIGSPTDEQCLWENQVLKVGVFTYDPTD